MTVRKADFSFDKNTSQDKNNTRYRQNRLKVINSSSKEKKWASA
ncbi:hypothetical protein GCAAIG_09440 [Candidatus Electronema halotolerans]|jgi:hypothetical protein